MKRDGDVPELFADDDQSYKKFEQKGLEVIKTRLRERGIKSEPDSLETKARAHFSVGFWGHKVHGIPCDDLHVFYVMARGVEHTTAGEFEDTWEWSSLGSAIGAKLEAAMLHELELALEDYLRDRTTTTPDASPN